MPSIHDVTVRPLEVNADERGHLVEMFRRDWDEFEVDPAMAYYSMTDPGVIRAWHRHSDEQIDYFVCPQGRITVAIYDDRPESPTEGSLDEFVIGEHNQQLIRIPGDCWHGFKALGTEPALLVNFPTQLYDYEQPDEQRLSYDTDEIPYDWEAPPHR